jgi:hypothetical protein
MYPYRCALSEEAYVEISKLQRRLFPGAKTLAEWILWLGLGFVFMSGWAYLGDRQNPSEAMFWGVLGIPCLLFGWLRRSDPRKVWRATPTLQEPYVGQVTQNALETRIVGVDARIPWQAFTTWAGSSRAVVLHAGQIFVPLAREFFSSDDEWHAVRKLIEGSVPVSESQGRAGGRAVARTVILWLVLLLVILLAWHFAQVRKG